MKKINKALYISSILCLLPVVLGLSLYSALPEQIPIHWNSSGEINNYTSKALAVFGLPLFLCFINLVIHITIDNDPKRQNSSAAMKIISKWIVPVISIVFIPSSFFIAMGTHIDITIIALVLVGVIIVICGNYMPKCKQNYTVGIKLPWTLSSTENWNKTHRLAGYIWMIGGILMIINAFLSFWYIEITLILLICFIPSFYSFLLYKKGV